MKYIKFFTITCIIIGIIMLCYFYIDRELVYFLFKHHSRQYNILKIMADIIPSIIAVGIFIFYIYIGYKNINRKITCLEHKLIIVANSVVIAIFLKDGLKNIFGRYWAETFYCNNMSLLRNNAYGFQWLQNANNSSFPSGHTTLIFAFIISLNHFFPKLKSLWVTTAVVVCVGQIGMYYHYVSDVLTGAILGSLSAWLSIRISQQNYEQKNNLMM